MFSSRAIVRVAAVAVVMGITLTCVSQSSAGLLPPIAATDRGQYNVNNEHDGSNLSYITGSEAVSFISYNSFFVFQLPNFNGPVVSATLQLYNPNTGYNSQQSSETFELFDVSTNIATLTGGGTVPGTYNDLGTGTSYGSVVIQNTDINTAIEISLNQDFLDYAEANAGNTIALGGTLSSLVGGLDAEFVFGFTSLIPLDDTQLVIDVFIPEPASMSMLALGGLAMLRRRKRILA